MDPTASAPPHLYIDRNTRQARESLRSDSHSLRAIAGICPHPVELRHAAYSNGLANFMRIRLLTQAAQEFLVRGVFGRFGNRAM